MDHVPRDHPGGHANHLQPERAILPSLRPNSPKPSISGLTRPLSPPNHGTLGLTTAMNPPIMPNLRLPSFEPQAPCLLAPNLRLPNFDPPRTMTTPFPTMPNDNNIGEPFARNNLMLAVGEATKSIENDSDTFRRPPAPNWPATPLSLPPMQLPMPTLSSSMLTLTPTAVPRLDRPVFQLPRPPTMLSSPAPPSAPHPLTHLADIASALNGNQQDPIEVEKDETKREPLMEPCGAPERDEIVMEVQCETSSSTVEERSEAKKDTSPAGKGTKFASLERPFTRLFSTLASSSTPSIVNLLKSMSSTSQPISTEHAPQEDPQEPPLSSNCPPSPHDAPTASSPEYVVTDNLEKCESCDMLEQDNPQVVQVDLTEDTTPITPNETHVYQSDSKCLETAQRSDSMIEENDRVQVVEPPRTDSSSPLSGALSTINHLLEITANSHLLETTIPSIEEVPVETEPTKTEYIVVDEQPDSALSIDVEDEIVAPSVPYSSELCISSTITQHQAHNILDDPSALYSSLLKTLAAGINILNSSPLLFLNPILASSISRQWVSFSAPDLSLAPHVPPQSFQTTLDSVEIVEDHNSEPAFQASCVQEPPDADGEFESSTPLSAASAAPPPLDSLPRLILPFDDHAPHSDSNQTYSTRPIVAPSLFAPLQVSTRFESFVPRSSSPNFMMTQVPWDPDGSVSESITFDQFNADSSFSSQCGPFPFESLLEATSSTFPPTNSNSNPIGHHIVRDTFGDQVKTWTMSPRPETCPISVQFLVSLFTFTKNETAPPRSAQLGAQFSTAPSRDMQAYDYGTHQRPNNPMENKKKRRMILHPMVLEAPAPQTKKVARK